MTNWFSQFFHKNEKSIYQTISYSVIVIIFSITLTLLSKFGGVSFFIVDNKPVEIEGPNEIPVIIVEKPREEYLKELSTISNIDEKIAYIITNGKKGEDYISFIQEKQNTNLGITREQNNIILTGYINKFLYPFPLSNDRNGFLVVTTNKPVAQNRDLLLGLNGKNMGAMIKGKDLSVKDDNTYVFDIRSIPMADVSLKGSVNLINYITGGSVKLSSVVGEKGNSVDEIVIAFVPNK